MTEKIRIDSRKLFNFAKQVMKKSGCSDSEAEEVATVLVEADLRGIHSHGVARLKRYVDHINAGIIKPKAEPQLINETPLGVVYNGNGGVGQHVSMLAMNRCIEKAGSYGVGFCSVKNSNHFGIAGYYAEMASKKGHIGIALTNTAPLVVPTFSKEPVLGTNPISVAIPMNNNTFLLDMATSVVPRGKLEVYNRLSKALPQGWAVNSDGLPTSDPSEALVSLSNRSGGLLPLGGAEELFGGHKGYGLSLLVELLTAGLSLGKYSKETYNQRGEICHFFGAINLEIFGDKNSIIKRISEIVKSVINSKKAKGSFKVYYHGEKEYIKRHKSLNEGIELDFPTIESLDILADKCGLNKLVREVAR